MISQAVIGIVAAITLAAIMGTAKIMRRIWNRGWNATVEATVTKVTTPQFAALSLKIDGLSDKQSLLHADNKQDHGRVVERLSALEARVGKLENALTKETGHETDHPPTPR